MESGSMRHIRVTIPSVSNNIISSNINMNSPRITITRQSAQTVLNSSIPAKGQGEEDLRKLSPRKRGPGNGVASPRIVRTAPASNAGAATNEFVGRTRTGPNRQPAKTSIVDFQVGGLPIQPRERRHVRGVAGFYPPLRMKSGSGSGKFAITETVSSAAWSPRPSQEPETSSSSQQFSVELAPQTSDLGPDSVPKNKPNIDWLKRRNNAILLNNNSNFTRDQDDSSSAPSRRPRSPPAPGVTGLQRSPRKKDAAWVRAFKVKQTRNNRYKDMDLGSKSMTNLDEGPRRRGPQD